MSMATSKFAANKKLWVKQMTAKMNLLDEGDKARAEMESDGIRMVSDAELQAIPHQRSQLQSKSQQEVDQKNYQVLFHEFDGCVGGNDMDPTLKRQPMFLKQCPYCCIPETTTRIETFPTWETYTLSIVLLILFWPACWIPLFVKSCQQTDHFCQHCETQVGSVPAFDNCCVTWRG